VNVRRKCAADREAVGARLLLRDPPLRLTPRLRVGEVSDHLGPLDTGFDLERPELGVEPQDAVHPAGVDGQAVRAELLTSHRVPTTGNRDGRALARRAEYRLLNGFDTVGRDNVADTRFVQLRVHVVHGDTHAGSAANRRTLAPEIQA